MNSQNVFWSLKGTDVYKALSWDRLHAYHHGLFVHILGEFKKTIEAMRPTELGRIAESQINNG